MDILHPKKEEFEKLLKESEFVVVDFFATWCGPCKMFTPILEEFAIQNESNIKIAKIDIDENEELAIEYNIQAVPTILVFKNNNEISRRVGVITLEELKGLVK